MDNARRQEGQGQEREMLDVRGETEGQNLGDRRQASGSRKDKYEKQKGVRRERLDGRRKTED